MTLTPSSDHGSKPNGCTVPADLLEWLLPYANTQQEKKTPAEMVAMNRFRPDSQTASTPLATKVAGESPQNLLNLLNLFRETDQHLDNHLGKPISIWTIHQWVSLLLNRK